MKKGDLMCVSDLSPSCVSSHIDVHLHLRHIDEKFCTAYRSK
jgi:hypothetical protein